MASDSTLHIKLDSQLAARLKSLADRKGISVSALVRQALISTYQPEVSDLQQHQRQVLEAYSGGFISIGKLAEVMGQHVLETRTWLRNHAIPENVAFDSSDIDRA